MADTAGNPAKVPFLRDRSGFQLALLLGFYVIICCVSLTQVANFYQSPVIIAFESARIGPAILIAAPFALTAILFAVSRFSFGYFLGFCLYTVILGYLWLVEFSVFPYEHRWPAASAAFSGLFFLLPALMTASPFRQGVALSPRAFDRMLTAILFVGAAILAAGALSNFRLVGIDEIYAFREDIHFPAPLGYAIGATSMVLLPFAFAAFLLRGARWRAAAVLLLLLMFYPVTLTKLTLFAPFWLLLLLALSKFAEIRIAVVLSLAVPIAIGVVLGLLYKTEVLSYEVAFPFFGAVNFRTIAVASLAIDIYNDFFATHPVTYFCQISVLKAVVACPYGEPLALLMANNYELGNLNASLLATEGVASVGVALAPMAALACGFVIALGNRASAGLPARFILLSSGMLVQVLLNLPLTIGMVTYGGALLFLLWYVTPRNVFELPVRTGAAETAKALVRRGVNSSKIQLVLGSNYVRRVGHNLRLLLRLGYHFILSAFRRFKLPLLLGFHVIICCVSLTYVAYFYATPAIVAFESARIGPAILITLPFALAAVLFAVSRFSFGYFVGFGLYTVILGYLWLIEFSVFPYEHRWPAVSAAFSGLFLLLPALAAASPFPQRFVLSPHAFDRALTAILFVGAATLVAGALYNFRLVGIGDIYAFRDDIRFPTPIAYAIGVTSNVLLPFAFAGFTLRRDRWRAAAALALILLFYPVTLTKLTLFAPLWLLFLTVLSRSAEARLCVVLSLCTPLAVGVVLAVLSGWHIIPYQGMISAFGAINFRMIAVPSLAIDIYNDFFANHSHTYFCQISFLKLFVHCPYSVPLASLMAANYELGNLNASLFATEGVASVGPALAPLAALAGGLVIALGNRASAGLPARFVLLSGAIAVQSFLNVPLTIALITNGTALLFLLWYVTPRMVFGEK
jgi:hypothetical protein